MRASSLFQFFSRVAPRATPIIPSQVIPLPTDIPTNPARYRQSRILPEDATIDWNTPWGDVIPDTKPEGTIRLLFQNVNGIARDENFSDAEHLGSTATEMQVDYLGLIETKLDWQARDVHKKCESIFRKYWKHTKLNTASSDDRFNNDFQPGGVASVIGAPWSGKCTAHNRDLSGMGRWTETTMTGKDGHKVTIITAYRVCSDSMASATTRQSYAQQWRIMRTANDPNPDPRRRILEDLETRIRKLREDPFHEVILGIDANETLQHGKGELHDWVQRLGLVDIHVHSHGTEGEPPTYSRGKYRIDYIFTTPGVANTCTYCGILPLQEASSGDHRGSFADFKLGEFLGGNPEALLPPVLRGIQSHDPRAVKMYQEKLTEFLDTSEFESRMATLKTDIETNGFCNSHSLTLDLMDHELTEARLQIERDCQKIPLAPWSPKLIECKQQCLYWKAWLTELNLNRDLSQQRRRKWPSAPTLHERPTLSQVKAKYRASKRAFKVILAEAALERKKHLQERAEMAGALDEVHTQKIIRGIIKAEDRRATFSRLRRILKPERSGGLNHVLVQNPDSTWRNVFEWNEMTELLLDRNVKHFSQADGTPFASDPLKHVLGPAATNSTSQEILDGNTSKTDALPLTEATHEILRHLKRLAPPNSVSSQLTADDIKRGYRKWRENTSTSPSGLHLGHDKALFQFTKQPEPEEDIPLAEQPEPTPLLVDRIMQLKADFLNLAIDNNHVYPRWNKVVNALIEKIPGQPRLNKLRVIHLIESDLNLLVGILWGRRLVKQGEALNAFGEAQAGSRPNRKAQDLLLFKHATYSIMRMSQTNGASFDNDATACFDRIVLTLGSLCSQQLGLGPKACDMFLKALDRIKYHVKTQHGTSTDFYTNTEKWTLHGPGQGGRASPSLWLIISCLIMELIKLKSEGMSLTDPEIKYIVEQVMTGFVDDTTIWINRFIASLNGEDSLESLVDRMKTTAQWWEQLLHATGGKLELPKCFFYVIFWAFDDEGVPRLMTPAELDTTVTVIDSETGAETEIEQKSCTTSHKTLGVLESPSGVYTDEYNRLANKGKQLAQKVTSGSLYRHEARVVTQSIYKPSMTYSLVVGTYSLKECNAIQSPPTSALTSALGYNSSQPSEVTYGPVEYGGVGFPHLFVEQGIQKVQAILQHTRTTRPLGDELIIWFRWAQRVAGTQQPIFFQPAKHLPQLDSEKWIQTLREFLSKSHLQLYLRDAETGPTPLRLHDRVLMDHPALDDFTKPNVRRINRCRLYLRAARISDLTNPRGTNIPIQIINCLESARLPSVGYWPYQPRPGIKHRKAWRKFMAELCQPKIYRKPNTALRQPLGDWVASPTPIWTTYYDPTAKAVYHHTTNWTSYPVNVKPRRHWPVLTDGETMQSAPDPKLGLIPTEWTVDPRGNTGIQIPPSAPAPPPDVDTSSWETYCSTLPAWEQDLLLTFEPYPGSPLLSNLLQDHSTTLYIATDGSQIGEFGSYSVVIGTDDHTIYIASAAARGSPMNVYRAECYGKLAAITFLTHYLQHFQLTARCTTTHYTDCEKVLKKTIPHRQATPRDTTTADFDITWTTVAAETKFSRISKKFKGSKYVKGHQDDDKPYGELSRKAQLNVQAHVLANNMAQQLDTTAAPIPMIPLGASPSYVIREDDFITSGETHLLRTRWSEFQLQEYLEQRLKLTRQGLRDLAWDSYRLVRKRESPDTQRFMTKLLTGWLPTGSKLAQYGNTVIHCPLCQHPTEDFHHIMRCPARQSWRDLFIQQLREFLADNDTCPQLIEPICTGCSLWLNSATPAIPENPDAPPAFNTQTQSGWHLFFIGLPHSTWATHQQQFLEKEKDIKNKPALGVHWLHKIIKWTIHELFRLWKSRNDDVHKPKDTPSRLEQETHARVRHLYSLADQVGHADRVLFDVPIENRLTHHWTSLAAWVSRTLPVLKVCMQDHAKKQASGQRDLRNYFQARIHQDAEQSEPTSLA